MVKQARMEIHFARNNYFLEENQILRNCHVLKKTQLSLFTGVMILFVQWRQD
jgi:hypothetical protein